MSWLPTWSPLPGGNMTGMGTLLEKMAPIKLTLWSPKSCSTSITLLAQVQFLFCVTATMLLMFSLQ